MDKSHLFRLVEKAKVTSTNELIKQAIDEGAAEGLAIRADEQTGGYGRYERFWTSPLGGLYLSVLLKPSQYAEHAGESLPSSPSTLSLVVGLAIREALAEILGSENSCDIQVKWPNDVVVAKDYQDNQSRFSKLCGISLEQRKDSLCIGIGVNVFHPQTEGAKIQESSVDSDSNSGRNTPAYLEDLIDRCSDLSISHVCNEILNKLSTMYKIWLDAGLSPFVDAYSSCAYLRGKIIDIVQMDGSIISRGKVLGIDDSGCLLLEKSDGSIERIFSGEARIALV